MYCNNTSTNNIGILTTCLLPGCGPGGNAPGCGPGGCGPPYAGNVPECGPPCGGKGPWGGPVCGPPGGK